VEVLTPNSAERRSTINGPNEMPPKSTGPNLKSSHDRANKIASGISSGALIVNSLDIALAGKIIDRKPTIKENISKNTRDRHQMGGGKKLKNVIIKRTKTVEILQVELAKIGASKNNRIHESFIRGSMTRSQLDLPETY